MDAWRRIALHISESTGEEFTPGSPSTLGGGCINQAMGLHDGRRAYFVKLNAANMLPMFEAEMAGLRVLAATGTLRVPAPVCTGKLNNHAYLVMELLSLGRSARGSEAQAGHQLAAMHRTTQRTFGWERDNTIGSTPQRNTPTADWVEFWREQRLGFQLALAAEKGYSGSLQRHGEQLLDRLPQLLEHDPPPSLLHGDLWSGNLGYDAQGHPVVYDPAVYFGDREADLAMTELFGGFGGNFYAAYREAWPLNPGYETRRILYNLYHILNHLNLFGAGYLSQAQGMIDRLLAQVR